MVVVAASVDCARTEDVRLRPKARRQLRASDSMVAFDGCFSVVSRQRERRLRKRQNKKRKRYPPTTCYSELTELHGKCTSNAVPSICLGLFPGCGEIESAQRRN